ncbi:MULTISPECIES: hypothetical protein [Nocardia]|uniref:hypothetical protein n=1 Tax=Nocardia TaxID=1817 RepID=UPI000D68EB5C|nr:MULTISPECIES: hypothetical protein [Nocardia]
MAKANARREHWTEAAERVGSDSYFLLGEDEDGNLCAATLRGDWYGPIKWWNPLHWLAYLGSRITGRLVWLERGDSCG